VTVVVDASVWVSSLLADDAFYAPSHEWLRETARRGPLVAPALMLAEVAGALSRRTGDVVDGQKALRSLLRLQALRIVTLDQRLGEAAARLAARGALRGADAVYAGLAQALRIPLVTWDDELKARAARWIAVYDPLHQP
jgi:predicted nucleic acid-binding protein